MRIETRVPLALQRGASRGQGVTAWIEPDALLLRTTMDAGVGEELRFALAPPGHKGWILGQLTVTRRAEAPGGVALLCRITSMPPDQRALLDAWLRDQEVQQAPPLSPARRTPDPDDSVPTDPGGSRPSAGAAPSPTPSTLPEEDTGDTAPGDGLSPGRRAIRQALQRASTRAEQSPERSWLDRLPPPVPTPPPDDDVSTEPDEEGWSEESPTNVRRALMDDDEPTHVGRSPLLLDDHPTETLSRSALGGVEGLGFLLNTDSTERLDDPGSDSVPGAALLDESSSPGARAALDDTSLEDAVAAYAEDPEREDTPAPGADPFLDVGPLLGPSRTFEFPDEPTPPVDDPFGLDELFSAPPSTQRADEPDEPAN